MLFKRPELALPQRCCQRGDTSLSFTSPGSRQTPSWFARGRRDLCKRGRSQSFGRGWLLFFNSCPGTGFIQCHVGLVGNVEIHGVADSEYSKGWGREFCCRGRCVGCGGVCVVGSATEASSVGFPFLGVPCSQLHGWQPRVLL